MTCSIDNGTLDSEYICPGPDHWVTVSIRIQRELESLETHSKKGGRLLHKYQVPERSDVKQQKECKI